MSTQRGRDGLQGRDGRQGLAGRDGDKGAPGVNSKGDRGPEGRTGRAGPLGVGLFTMLLVYVTFGWWASEHHACQRSNATRSAVRIFSSTAFEAQTAAARLDRARDDRAAYAVDHGAARRYATSIRRASALDCSGLFPDAK